MCVSGPVCVSGCVYVWWDVCRTVCVCCAFEVCAIVCVCRGVAALGGSGKGRHGLGLKSGSAEFPLSGPCVHGNLSDSYTHTHTHTHTHTLKAEKQISQEKDKKKTTHEIRFLNKIVKGNCLYSRREEFLSRISFHIRVAIMLFI